jgi:enamine deaminase RidA (YjgF/YER057c/UK114 family)
MLQIEELRMPVERFGVHRLGGGQVLHAPFVRAGRWVFANGIRAVGADGLLSPEVHDPRRPYATPPKAEREARFVFERLRHGFAEAGGDLANLVRLDQYYPDWRAVDPYHVARKQALAGSVPPSTSILVGGLLNPDAALDVQALATTRDSGLHVGPVKPEGLAAPIESGYAPCQVAGDLVFVAGQLARDGSGELAPEATVPTTHLWKGTRIRKEADYLVRHRIAPALKAAGSDLSLVLKAQVYISEPNAFPAFWQSWSEGFDGRVPPTTVVPVPHPAFNVKEARLEINVVAATGHAAARVRDIDCDVALLAPDMVPARAFDDLLFVAGLMAIDEGGLIAGARIEPRAPYYVERSRAEMADIIAKAGRIFAAAGTDLAHMVRLIQFHVDLSAFHGCCTEWQKAIGEVGLPIAAVEVGDSILVPEASVVADVWGYIPPR